MNKKDLILRSKVIKETFNDNRKLIAEIPEDKRKIPPHTYRGGDLFKTDDGEIIDLELQITDFDENELVKYVELAEELYESYKTHISIYILCNKNVSVTVKECDIMSEALFTIKLATHNEDIAKIILDTIKTKIKKRQKITDDDLDVLKMLPIICEKKDRNHYRKEYFRILNIIF